MYFFERTYRKKKKAVNLLENIPSPPDSTCISISLLKSHENRTLNTKIRFMRHKHSARDTIRYLNQSDYINILLDLQQGPSTLDMGLSTKRLTPSGHSSQNSFSRLLNPGWLIQFSGVPAVCEAVRLVTSGFNFQKHLDNGLQI